MACGTLPVTGLWAQDDWDFDFVGDVPTPTDSIQTTDVYQDDEVDLRLSGEDFVFPTSLTDGWHFTLHLGEMQSWGSHTKDAKFFNKSNYGAGASIGKYLSPVNDVRIQFVWGRGTGVYGGQYDNSQLVTSGQKPNWHWNVVSLGFQYLPNITNLIWGYKEDRLFTFSGIMGIDLERTFHYRNSQGNLLDDKDLTEVSVWAEKARSGASRSLVGLQAGLNFEFRLSDRLRVAFEATNVFLDDTYDGYVTDQKWDGHINLFAGLTWHLRKNRNANLSHDRFNPAKYNEMEETIFLTRKATQDALEHPNIIRDDRQVSKNITYTLVAMDEGILDVPRLQQTNIYTTATIWANAADKSMIFITNSSKKDDNTFRQRAWSISNLLSNRWQVNPNDITIIADENRIKDMQFLDYKNYIIVIIND